MHNYYYLEIEFLDVDFDSYLSRSMQKTKKVHKAHLFTNNGDIELKIFYDDSTYFGEKLMFWTAKLDLEKFGSYIKINKAKSSLYPNLHQIDLSGAKLISLKNSSNYYESGKKYTIIKIDTVKFYWHPSGYNVNSAEFYLSDNGFRILESFYSVLSLKSEFKNHASFDIKRMDNSKKYYKLGKSKFRPEFDFITKDERKGRVATITKEPKIHFFYNNDITENDAILYGDIVLYLASFYYHIKIDYILKRIYLKDREVTIRNVENKNFNDIRGDLSGFGISWDFNKFLESSWQKDTIKNFSLISKAIDLYNQSHIVDDYSSFLIRYNIIEICDKIKYENYKFKIVVSDKDVKEKKKEALDKLLEIIDLNEHDDFRTRWNSVLILLQNKPMKNQLFTFLEQQNLKPDLFPISIEKLKTLRNSITHGSIDKVNSDFLKQANQLLYRISGILILNLMGIKEWKLYTHLND